MPKVPVIKHYKGVCHVYVDGAADLQMAEEIVLNAKVQRPGVCNAMETLLVDKTIAPDFLPAIAARLGRKKLNSARSHPAGALRPARTSQRAGLETLRSAPATDQDFFTEYNDYILNVRVVDGVQQAIDHINHYGSAHSDSIVTRDEARASSS